MMYGPYPGKIVDWHDGDTCRVMVDLGFGFFILPKDFDGKPLISCRIYGIDAPELSDPDGSGKTALAYAVQICPPETRVTILSHNWDKYGRRFDGSLTLPNGSDFAQMMLESGHAKMYNL
jgi:endonuclease YncB( thermonuclease family)